MNTSLSLTKYLLSLNLAIIIYSWTSLSSSFLPSKLPVPSPLLSFILNLTTASHYTIIFLSLSLHWLKINERITYKLLSLTYKVLTTNLPQYLYNSISVQLVTTHVLHLWSLLLSHLPTPLWKSQVAPLGMLHPLYGMNFPSIFVSLIRHNPLHFLLSHMAVHHHLHHLHYHRLHLLLLAQCFILNSRLGSSANPFLHRPFPLLLDWLHGLSDHIRFYSAQQLYW